MGGTYVRKERGEREREVGRTFKGVAVVCLVRVARGQG